MTIELLSPKNDDHEGLPAFDLVAPDEAREKLVSMGYEEANWDEIIGQDVGGHYTKALVQVARSSEPLDWNEVYHEVKPDLIRYSEADNLAEIAAMNAEMNGAWAAFVASHEDVRQ
jgi:hypothetical protein